MTEGLDFLNIGSELFRALAVSGIFLSLIIAADMWHRNGGPAETTRKLVHIGGGLVCLFFPYVFRSPVTVAILAGAISTLFFVTRKFRLLKGLHGVERSTRGTEYYPVAIFLVFLIAGHDPWRYIAALSVLAAADGFAALIGTWYGSIRYMVEEDSKSLEGSIGFLIIAFLSVHIPVLLMTSLPRSICLLAALYVALLVTGFEAISLRGTDNLFIPLGVCIILEKITRQTLLEITYQLASLAIICIGLGILARRSRVFNTGGIIALVLFIYGAWSLGSEWWAFPGIAAFLIYLIVWQIWPLTADGGVRVSLVTRALGVPFCFLLFGNMLREPSFFFPGFAVTVGTVTGIVLWNHGMIRVHRHGTPKPWSLSIAAGVVSAAVITGTARLNPIHGVTFESISTAVAIAGGILVNTGLSRHPKVLSADALYGWTQIVVVTASGVVAWLLPWLFWIL
ncbi:MAG TPA: hypothetical protein PLV45_01745 [bacterium]|nr:hypothetical protein [bacterium]